VVSVAARSLKGHQFNTPVLQLPSETRQFKKLTTAIAVSQQSWANCLLAMLVPRPTQPSIPPGSVNEDQLRLESQRQVWFIPLADKCVGGK